MRMSDKDENSQDQLQGGSRIHLFKRIRDKIMQRTRKGSKVTYEEESQDREDDDRQIFFSCGCKVTHYLIDNLGNINDRWDSLHVINSNLKLCEEHEKKVLKYIGKIRTIPTDETLL